MKKEKLLFPCFIMMLSFILISSASIAQEKLPYYLKDRGTGIPTSMFGTYINKGELMIYPFYSFWSDSESHFSNFQGG